MQTTLLGLAIAVIVALVVALVGPLMVDWGIWRTKFEAEASRAVGMPVRITGDIDVRLLPVPSLTLRRIEAGAPGAATTVKARALEVELALGPLVRGEWRADQFRLDGPEVALGVDRGGALVVPSTAIGFDPDQLAIDRLVVSNARITLTDAANGATLAIDDVALRGEARSLIGPFKAEGTFATRGQHYAFRIAGARRGDDGGMKLRINVDAVDHPLSIETEATVWAGERLPRYDGTLTLSRPAGQVLSSGRTITSVPWRASGHIRGTSAAALVEQIEFQYGGDEQAAKFSGSAQLTLGVHPRFDGVVSTRQFDADRWLTPDAARRPPAALLSALSDRLTGLTLPLPVTLGIGIDNLAFGGANLQAVRGDVRVESDVWNLDGLEFRAPGLTQVRLSGEVGTRQGIEFTGPAVVESAEPRALVAWLEGRADVPRVAGGALSARGDITLGRERMAVERLRAEFDRRAIEGRLAYAFAAAGRPARLEADLNAAELDVDAALAFAGNAFAGAALDRPGEVALALDFGKAIYAGVEARGTKAKLTFDDKGLAIDQLAIADVNGAKIDARGRIDDLSKNPHGTVTLAVDAQRLDGAARLAARLAPQAGRAVEGLAAHAAATRLNARLDIGAAAAGTAATLAVDGAIGPVKVAIKIAGRGDAAAPRSAMIDLDGRLDSDDGAALAALIGLDRYAAVDKRTAHLTLRAGGRIDDNVNFDVAFVGPGLDARGGGTLAVADAGTKGAMDVAVAAADLKPLRSDAAAPVAVDLAARVGIDADKVSVANLKGTIAGSAVGGQVALTLGRPLGIDGRLDVERVDLARVLGLSLGMASPSASRSGWLAEPFAVAPGVELSGRLAFTARRATLTPTLAADDLRGTLTLAPAAADLELADGHVANGGLSGAGHAQIADNGVSLRGNFALAGADLARLLSAPTRPSGRMNLRLEAAGIGRSPAALIGALRGAGTFTIDDLRAPGLDPDAIAAAVRAADQGMPIDIVRIGDVVRSALDRGSLTVPRLAGNLAIADGRASVADVKSPAGGNEFSLSGSFDLADQAVDLRLGLTGPAGDDAPGGTRPRLDVTLKGPSEAPRRSVDVGALVGWLTLRSVEREAKRLEAAEQQAKRLQAIAREAKQRAELEAAKRREQEMRAMDQQTGVVAAPPPGDTSASGRAPALPPPIDIRPVPTDRRRPPAVPYSGTPPSPPPR